MNLQKIHFSLFELIIRVWDYPNKQNGHGPAGAGFGRFPGVWPHSLCLLRYPSPRSASPVLRTNKTPGRSKNAHQRQAFSGKERKKIEAASLSQNDLYSSNLIAPSMVASTIGRYFSGHSFNLWLTR